MKILIVLTLCSLSLNAFSGDNIEHPASELKKLVTQHCGSCHIGSGDYVGLFGDFTKFNVLQRREKLSTNILLKKVESGEMPLTFKGDFLSTEQRAQFIEAINNWYSAGMPQLENQDFSEIITQENIFELILSDIEKNSNDSEFIRYISFASIYNGTKDSEKLSYLQQAFTKLINSISWGENVVEPRDVDGRGILFAIDLRNYKISPNNWNSLIEEDYPYNIFRDSLQSNVEKINETLGSKLPYLKGDWFVNTVSRAPIYDLILELPKKLSELESLLGIDREANIRGLKVLRAGFMDSGVSQHNRLIERHDSKYGAFWMSYDFSESLGKKSFFEFPLGPKLSEKVFTSEAFEHDGGEVIFNLPNGLQAYLLVDSEGNTIAKAPTNIVSDPNRRDRTVVNGLSCMGCHKNGMIIKPDQVFKSIFNGRFKLLSAFDRIAVKKMYSQEALFLSTMESDRDRFLGSLEKINVKSDSAEVINYSSTEYNTTLSFEQFCGELGLAPELVLGKLEGLQNVSTNAYLLFAQTAATGIRRDLFEAEYSTIIEAVNFFTK